MENKWEYAVLDLDQTLVHTFNEEVPLSLSPSVRDRLFSLRIPPEEGLASGVVYDWWGIERPHLREFLSELDNRGIKVVVWSAADPIYVKQIVERIFQQKPILTLTCDHIQQENDSYSKPLSKVHSLIEGSSESNTFILDDREDNFMHNRSSGMLIPAYSPENSRKELESDDTALLDVIHYLDSKTWPTRRRSTRGLEVKIRHHRVDLK